MTGALRGFNTEALVLYPKIAGGIPPAIFEQTNQGMIKNAIWVHLITVPRQSTFLIIFLYFIFRAIYLLLTILFHGLIQYTSARIVRLLFFEKLQLY